MSPLKMKIAVLFAVVAATFSGSESYTMDNEATPMPIATVIPAGNLTRIANIIKYRYNSSEDDSDSGERTENVTERDADDPIDSTNSSGDDSTESDDDSIDSVNSTESNHDSYVSGSASLPAVMKAAFKLGSVMNATSTIKPTYSNWVGTALDTSFTAACWRKAHIAKTCPLGYNHKFGMCWTQCPYSYPVQCGIECVRQNDDCASAVAYKVAVVVQTALGITSWSIFGDMTKWAKGIQTAVKCTKYMISLAKSLVRYTRFIKVHDPQTPIEEIFAVLYQIDNVIIDIPVAIAYCMGGKVSDDIKFTDYSLTTAEYIIREVVYNGDFILTKWSNFKNFMKNITFGGAVNSLKKTDIKSMKSALKSNTTCGYDMKRLLDRTWMTVAELRRLNPQISEDDIRVIMSHSNLVLNDIPIATNNCMNELLVGSDIHTAYATRDKLRKTFGAVVDDLIKSGTSNNGTLLSAGEYAFKIADRAIAIWAMWDPFYISSIVSEFFQMICGPTQFIGEIDDGSAKKALGLTILQHAFNNSKGMWTKVGDGTVTITFKSVDTKDVSVNIKSGGHKIDEVDVPAGKTVNWTSNSTVLGGKTLYLDRWRPGLLGIPGTGGGSLMLWIPHSTQGGSLQLNAMLNVS